MKAFEANLGAGMTPRGMFGVGATITLLTLVGLFLGLLREGYGHAEERAKAATVKAAQTVSAELARAVRLTDGLLADLVAGGSSRDLQEVQRRLRDLPLVRSIVVLDAEHAVLLATDAGLDAAAFAAQPWLSAVRSLASQATVPSLGPPILLAAEHGRASDQWALPMASWSAGRIAVVLIDGAALRAQLREVTRLFAAEIRIYARDGTLYMATDLPSALIGRRDPASTAFGFVVSDLPIGTKQGLQDGRAVIASFDAGPRSPFVVAASQTEAAAFAVWHVEAMVLGASFVAVCLVVFGALWLLFRMSDRLWRQRDQLSRSERRTHIQGRAEQDFLAAMSNEIRTPMNGVIGMAGLLMETKLDLEQARYTRTIQSSAEHLLSVMNGIIDYSKIERGALDLESVPFLLEEEVASVTEHFAPATAARGVEIVCRLGEGLPMVVVGDPGRFRQILLNIVGNAVKFTDRGWIEIALDARPLDGGRLLFEARVSDTGIGVDPSRLPMLFQRLSQAEPGTDRRYGGTGLGLAICRELVQAMGGSIGAAVRPGGGSEFRYTLVLRSHDDLATPEAFPLRSRRCLVVDDLRVSREIMVRQLATLGAHPDTAGDGVEALVLVRNAARAGRPYHLVLVDRAMPVMDGIAFAQAVRNDCVVLGHAVPRLVLCASVPSGEVRGGVELFDAQLIKPVLNSRLRSVVALLTANPAPAVALPEPCTALQPSAPPQPLAGLRILVAEDNPTNQIVTRAILQRAGARVEIVESGTEAVSMVRRFVFDALLMDLQMPGMDGLQATRLIRDDEAQACDRQQRKLFILGLTASADRETGARCRAVGMDGHLSKPIPRATLVAAVGQVRERMAV